MRGTDWAAAANKVISNDASLREDWAAGVLRIFSIEHVLYGCPPSMLSPVERSTSMERIGLEEACLNAAQVFSLAREANCQEAKDKIYGLLGVAAIAFGDKDISTFIPVDYTKTTEEVYKETTRCLLVHSTTLNVLTINHGPTANQKTSSLPSWVPDYREPHAGFHTSEGYASLGLTVPSPPFEVFNDSIRCQGYCFDVVAKTCDWMFNDFVVDEVDINLLEVAKLLPQRIAGRRRVEVLWRTLLANRDLHGYLPSDQMEAQFWAFVVYHVVAEWQHDKYSAITRSAIPNLMDIVQDLELGSDLQHKDIERMAFEYADAFRLVRACSDGDLVVRILAPVEEQFSDFLAILNSTIHMSRLFITRRGLLSFGIPTVQEGDEIWILATAGVPFILRLLANPGTYSFVGTCYILDHMHGGTRSEKYGTADALDQIEIR